MGLIIVSVLCAKLPFEKTSHVVPFVIVFLLSWCDTLGRAPCSENKYHLSDYMSISSVRMNVVHIITTRHILMNVRVSFKQVNQLLRRGLLVRGLFGLGYGFKRDRVTVTEATVTGLLVPGYWCGDYF